MRDVKWVIFDTNVYVAALREGRAGPSFDRLQQAAPRTVLASVVSAELRAGARDDAGRIAVSDLSERFERLGRIVVPTAASWDQAGDTLARIALREPGLRSKVHLLWNDALLALSVRQIGATLVTRNLRDFELLWQYIRFDLEQAPGAGCP